MCHVIKDNGGDLVWIGGGGGAVREGLFEKVTFELGLV